MVVDPVHIIITYRRALHTGKQLFMGRRKKQTIKLFWHFLIKEFLLGEKKKVASKEIRRLGRPQLTLNVKLCLFLQVHSARIARNAEKRPRKREFLCYMHLYCNFRR